VLLAINVLQRYSAWGSLGGYDDAGYSFAKIVSEGMPSVVVLLLAPLHRGLFPPWLLLTVGIVSAGVLLVGVLVGAQRRLFAFGLGWLALTLIPVLNLLPIPYDLQNTRLLYPAVVGYAVLIAAAAAGLIHLVARRWTPLLVGTLACSLTLAASITIHLHIQPWLVATKATEDLFAQIDEALPPARSGTILQYSGLPDNYEGAYIYRLGLDAAFIVRREQLYIHWPEYGHVPIPYQALGLDRDFFQVSVQNTDQQSWQVSQLRGVSFPAELPPFPQSHWMYAMGGEAAVRRLSASKRPHSKRYRNGIWASARS
jgi:hypothetical protein